MAKPLSLIIITTVVLLLSGCNENNDEKNMIKVIDVEKVISQSPLLSQENEHINKVRETLLAGKKAAESNYAKMPGEDAQKAALADKLMLEKNWSQQRRLARVATLDAIYSTVEKYRVENNIKFVAHKTAIIALGKDADISDEIITRLKDQTVKYAALPEISTRSIDTAPANETTAKTEQQE